MFFVSLLFQSFNVIVVCFCVSGEDAKVLKMLVFSPVLGAFAGCDIFLFVWV